jgi:hypothetical protein
LRQVGGFLRVLWFPLPKRRNIRLNWPIFTSIRVSLLMLTISLTEIKEKMLSLTEIKEKMSNTSIQINIYVHKKILLRPWSYGLFVCLMVFNATFNIISVLLVEETRGPGENHRPVASHWPLNINKNNNNIWSFEGLDVHVHYHYYHSSSCQPPCDTIDNVCLVFQNCSYSTCIKIKA